MAESKSSLLIVCGVVLLVAMLGMVLVTSEGREAFEQLTGITVVVDEYDVVLGVPGMPVDDIAALDAVSRALAELPDVTTVIFRINEEHIEAARIEVRVGDTKGDTPEIVDMLLAVIPEDWNAYLLSDRGRALDLEPAELQAVDVVPDVVPDDEDDDG